MERFRNNPELSGTPLIVVSGRDLKAHRERAIIAGAKSFLQKPVDNSVLLRVIHKLLGDQTPSYVLKKPAPPLTKTRDKKPRWDYFFRGG